MNKIQLDSQSHDHPQPSIIKQDTVPSRDTPHEVFIDLMARFAALYFGR